MNGNEEKVKGVLQCVRCGAAIDEGDAYADVAATIANCPSHEDYLDWSPDFEEYFCEVCWNSILNHMRGNWPTKKEVETE